MSDWIYLTPENWTEDLKILKEKTDKNILITYLIESCGYWPLLGDSNDNMLELIHNYSHPDNKIWYVNSDYNAQRNYDDWCELVKPKMRINMYPLVPSIAREVFVGRLRTYRELYHPVEDVDVPKKYRVICMVNQPKISRILTLRELAGQPGFIYSYNITEINTIGEKGDTTDESFMNHSNDLQSYTSWNWRKDGNAITYNHVFDLPDETIPVDMFCGYNMSNKLFDMTKRISLKTPFVDGFEGDISAFHDFLPVQEWLESEIDLVCETHQNKRWHFSDKVCKPLGFCKPFLVIGCVGWHKILEKLGFKLYDELFDYSFDEIESFRYRHEAIIIQIKSILEMDDNILKKKLHDIEDKIYYNKRLLLDYRDDMGDITNITKQIDDNS